MHSIYHFHVAEYMFHDVEYNFFDVERIFCDVIFDSLAQILYFCSTASGRIVRDEWKFYP